MVSLIAEEYFFCCGGISFPALDLRRRPLLDRGIFFLNMILLTHYRSAYSDLDVLSSEFFRFLFNHLKGRYFRIYRAFLIKQLHCPF